VLEYGTTALSTIGVLLLRSLIKLTPDGDVSHITGTQWHLVTITWTTEVTLL